jgi:hypothetical protein
MLDDFFAEKVKYGFLGASAVAAAGMRKEMDHLPVRTLSVLRDKVLSTTCADAAARESGGHLVDVNETARLIDSKRDHSRVS